MISIRSVDLNLWIYMLMPCVVVIAGNCLASVLSFTVRHGLREKNRWLELTIQLALTLLMTFVFPVQFWSNQMLATCDGFLLLLHNLALGKVSEMNRSD